MSSPSIRNPLEDHLLTPQNSALIVIDYQPIQVTSVASMNRQTLVTNITSVVKAAKLFKLPIILSTVNVGTNKNQDTIHQIKELLPETRTFDRTTINSWEDVDFVTAVKALNRKKLIMTALWTEACLMFPSLDAMREGFDVYPVVDAVGGTSLEAHHWALTRLTAAGAKPMCWVQLLCELQRDWNRHETASEFAKIVFAVEGH